MREYNRPPMRCYKCQRYGHAAAVCRGTRRCGKCGEDHEFATCQVSKAKCCNCDGDHVTGHRECEHHVRAVEVEKARAGGGMSYAEAVKTVSGPGARVHLPKPVVEVVPVQAIESKLLESKTFLAFVGEVIWETKNKTTKSDVMKAVTEAAARFLGNSQIGPEQVNTSMEQRTETTRRGARQVEGEAGSTDRSVHSGGARRVEGERGSTDRSVHTEEIVMEGSEDELNE